MTLRRTGSAVVAALLVSVAVGCSASDPSSSPPTPASSTPASPVAVDLAAPGTLRTSLEHAETKRPDAMVDWRTDWVLRWNEVPGATGYLVRFSTSEGRGGRERRLTTPELRSTWPPAPAPRAGFRPTGRRS